MGSMLWETLQFLSSSTLVNGLTLVGGAISLVTSLVAVILIIWVVRGLPPDSAFTVRLGLRGLRVEYRRGASMTVEARGHGGPPGDTGTDPVPETWQQYVEEQHRVLTKDARLVCRSSGLPWQCAEDLRQEVVIALASRWETARSAPAGPRGYAYGVMKNKAADLTRGGRGRNNQFNHDAGPLPDDDASSSIGIPGPEDGAVRRREVDRLMAAVRELPDGQYDVIVLVKLLELSIPDTARLLRKSEGAVRQAQFKAMKTLRRKFDSDGEGGNP